MEKIPFIALKLRVFKNLDTNFEHKKIYFLILEFLYLISSFFQTYTHLTPIREETTNSFKF